MTILKHFPKNKISGYNPDNYYIRLNYPLFRRTLSGDIGIEVEVEGGGLSACPFRVDGYEWHIHEDHSLRGGGAREYTTSSPVPIGKAPQMVRELYRWFRESGAVLNDSNRTSVHIHMNAQGLKMNELCSWICIWGILEDVLVNFCGPHRVGNLFCLRLRDADWGIERLVRMFQTGDPDVFRDNIRYLAVNPNALVKFNSLEFRSLRGTRDPDLIIQWINILWNIFQFSKRFPNPEEIAGVFSGEGPLGFLEKAIGRDNLYPVLSANVGEDVSSLIWSGIRRIQPVIYSLPWGSLMQEINAEAIPNPFPKPSKKNLGEWNWEVQDVVLAPRFRDEVEEDIDFEG